jgi:hypothetical protein
MFVKYVYCYPPYSEMMTCTYTQRTTIVGKTHIPCHFYLKEMRNNKLTPHSILPHFTMIISVLKVFFRNINYIRVELDKMY